MSGGRGQDWIIVALVELKVFFGGELVIVLNPLSFRVGEAVLDPLNFFKMIFFDKWRTGKVGRGDDQRRFFLYGWLCQSCLS